MCHVSSGANKQSHEASYAMQHLTTKHPEYMDMAYNNSMANILSCKG